jgi:hypothetical protein
MSLFNNLFVNLRDRMNAVIGAVIVSIAFCLCGAVMVFFLAPQQAMKAYQISKMPVMDAQSVDAAAAGGNVLITGYLQGEPATSDLPDFIAYTQERWEVTVSKDNDGKENTPSGSWKTEKTAIPALTLNVNDMPVNILASNDASFAGNLHETLIEGNGTLQADYNGKSLKDGSIRYQGFFDGDLTTVFGQKASVGGVQPQDIFAGDRVAYEAYQKQMAGAFLFGGLGMMICSPIVLVLGVLGAAFGKRK